MSLKEIDERFNTSYNFLVRAYSLTTRRCNAYLITFSSLTKPFKAIKNMTFFKLSEMFNVILRLVHAPMRRRSVFILEFFK